MKARVDHGFSSYLRSPGALFTLLLNERGSVSALLDPKLSGSGVWVVSALTHFAFPAPSQGGRYRAPSGPTGGEEKP